jgi:hypothetical protein
MLRVDGKVSKVQEGLSRRHRTRFIERALLFINLQLIGVRSDIMGIYV